MRPFPFVQDLSHKIERTETASAQFPMWKSIFWPHEQLKAVREKTSNL